MAPAGRLTGVRSLVFTDTEHVALDRYLTYPLATRICTPYTFKKRSDFEPGRPRRMTSRAYTAAFNETSEYGRADSASTFVQEPLQSISRLPDFR